MKLRNLVYTFVFMLCLFNVSAFCSEQSTASGPDDDLDERDSRALREYLKTKRQVPLEDKDENLSITGDIRFEWRHMHEEINGVPQRGHRAFDRYNEVKKIGGDLVQTFSAGLPISNNDFDVEFNLYFDYKKECSWASALVQYDEGMGVDDNNVSCKLDRAGFHGSGYGNKSNLKNAYFGGQLWTDGCSVLEGEMGRRANLYKVFTSKVQFKSRFDGILLHFRTKLPGWYEGYIKGAGFLIDERTNHFGWVAEAGLLNIMDCGFDLKYSFIHWNKKGINRYNARNPEGYRFQNSQITLAYHLNPDILNKEATIYGACVYNHADRKRWDPILSDCNSFPANNEGHPGVKIDLPTVNNRDIYRLSTKNQKTAWYVGFTVGKVRKEGDWSFEAQYQWVQAFAVPDGDMSGIGLGNVQGESITSTAGRGNTNFKGWRFEGLYAITDELTLDTIFEYTKVLNPNIGNADRGEANVGPVREIIGRHRYSKFEMEAIYAF